LRNDVLRTFTSPHHYIQGPGALRALGEVLNLRHDHAFVLIDEQVADLVGVPLQSSLDSAGVRYQLTRMSGEVTNSRIDQITARARSLAASIVIAAGGGKTLDTGKGVARALGCRIVTVPTIASNDGPTSRVIATYDDNHQLVATPQMIDNPYAVLVDTELIAKAPAMFLVSGIGDALAKRFEAAACQRGDGMTSNGTRPLALPSAIAECCFDVLMTHSSEAMADVRRRTPTPALEAVVEAVILMSGLAFENGGLSLAHSMTRGLMRVSGAADKPHGFQVAYGLLVQLVHESNSAEFISARTFMRDLGLPTTLGDLGTDASRANMTEVATATLTAPHMPNCVPYPSEASLVHAMRLVETGQFQ
jgi:glycerol dehydrogenase